MNSNEFVVISTKVGKPGEISYRGSGRINP